MEPVGTTRGHKTKQQPAADLPQWNARFRFTAQKGVPAAALDNSKDGREAAKASQQDRAVRTPHLASGARRVPVGRQGGNFKGGGATDVATPLTSDTTPTLCLFQRFESLTLNTPATATAAKPAMHCSASAAGPSCRTTSSSNSSQAALTGQAVTAAGADRLTLRPQRRSVAFGTPCVLAYTPASPANDTAQQDTTPLWSNAGHTPYSLNSKDCSEGGYLHAVCCAAGDNAEAGASSGCGSAVRMELFTSTIAETELQHTPAPTVSAPRTTADSPAAAGPAAEGAGERAAGASSCAQASPALKGADRQDAVQEAAAAAPSFSGDSSFTGFGPSAMGNAAAEDDGEASTPPFFRTFAPAAAKKEEESTPPFIGTAKSRAVAAGGAAADNTADVARCEACGEGASQAGSTSSAVTALARAQDDVSSKARGTGAGVGGSSSSCGTLGPPTTPRSRLKQPARVAIEGSRPAIPKELKQLLADPQAAAAPQLPAALGSCDMLSPVRPKKQLQHMLGAGEQVLSPVRRSTRKAPKHTLAADSSAVTPMLEATNYCYQGRGGSQPQPFGQ